MGCSAAVATKFGGQPFNLMCPVSGVHSTEYVSISRHRIIHYDMVCNPSNNIHDFRCIHEPSRLATLIKRAPLKGALSGI